MDEQSVPGFVSVRCLPQIRYEQSGGVEIKAAQKWGIKYEI